MTWKFSFKKALAKHKRRSKRAQAQDNRLRAKRVIRSRRQLPLWFKAPAQYDIFGIDYPARRRIIRRVKRRLHIRGPRAARKFSRFVRAYHAKPRISRRGRRGPMNYGLQFSRINQLIKSRGIARDLLDVGAHMDRTLSYRENKRNLIGQINALSPKHGLDMEMGAIRNMEAAYKDWEKNRNQWG